jgi:zinc/manganese transport system ATP-binding protein
MNGLGGAAIALRAATLRYGRHVIWENLDPEVAPGERLAVLGPNGAGKTTLLKVLLGLVPLSAGTVTIDGRPPTRGSPRIGYLAQRRAFDPDLPIRGRDLVQLGVDGHRPGLPWRRSRQARAAIEAVGAGSYAAAPVGLLSGGQQQRLRIAQTLAGGPRLLLCDEPLLSLDQASQQSVTALLDGYCQAHGTTMVLVTHEITPIAEIIDRVLYVAARRWAAGSPDTVMTTETLSALYGSRIDVILIHDRIVVVGEGAGPHHPPGGTHQGQGHDGGDRDQGALPGHPAQGGHG